MTPVISRLQAADARAAARLRAQAFQQDLGPDFDQGRPIDNDRVHVAHLDGRLVGTATVLPLAQWFGGRSLPMGGVAGVAVAPQARGRGLAKRLMTEAIEAMRERGEVISSLYPTSSTLYRAMGYEFAGRFERTTVEVAELTASARGKSVDKRFRVEELSAGEMTRMRPLYDALAAEANGWLDRTDYLWDRLDQTVNPERFNHFGYVLIDSHADTGPGDDRVEAGLTVANIKGRHRLKFDVSVGGPLARSADAMTAALDLIAGLGTTADAATIGLPVETLAGILPGAFLDHQESRLWMMRLIDVEAAIAGRGYNPAVHTRLQFQLHDPIAPWNEGRWSVSIAEGSATVERQRSATHGVVEIDAATLATLYTGFSNPWELARAGRLAGADSATLHALAVAFAGPPPRLIDFF